VDGPHPHTELLLSTGSVRGLSLTRLFALAETAGFSGLEYVVDQQHSPERVPELRSLIEETGLRIQNVHAPYMHLPGWGDPVKSVLRAVELAGQLEARSITFHPPQRVMEHVEFARWISKTGDFQSDVGRGKILVTMENMPKVKYWRGFKVPFTTSPFRYQNRDELWEILEKHNLFMTFDTTHYGTTGESLGACFSQFRDRVRTIHLSNFDAKEFEEHMPPQTGDLDLGSFLQRVDGSGYDGLMTLEVRPQELEAHPEGPREALDGMVRWIRQARESLQPDPHPSSRPV